MSLMEFKIDARSNGSMKTVVNARNFEIIVDEPELKNKVARATFSKLVSFNRFAVEAPVIAVLVIEKANLKTLEEKMKEPHRLNWFLHRLPVAIRSLAILLQGNLALN